MSSATIPVTANSMESYWATGSPADIAREARLRINNWRTYLRLTGFQDRIVRAHAEWYGTGRTGLGDASAVQKSGESGRNVRVRMGLAASLGRSVRSMVLQNVPDFDVGVDNACPQPLAAESAVRTFIRSRLRKGAQRSIEDAVTSAFIHSTGWVYVGDGASDGGPLVEQFGAYWVAIDPRCHPLSAPWAIVSRRVSKWELYAVPGLQQDVKDAIRSAPASQVPPYIASSQDQALTDFIDVHTLYHVKNAAVPEGLILTFLDDGLTYFGPAPFWIPDEGRLPLVPIMAEPMDETPLGDSPLQRILGISEAFDELKSRLLTSAMSTAKPVIVYPDTVDFGAAQLQADGVAAIPVPDGTQDKIKLLKWEGVDPAADAFANSLVTSATQSIGSNDIARGLPPPNVAAGNFAALMVETAVKFYYYLQSSVADGIAGVGDLLVLWMQARADQPIVIDTVGDDDVWRLQAFEQKDFAYARRIYAKPVAASQYSKQAAQALAQQLLQAGLIDAPTAIHISVTGSTELATSLSDREISNIRAENSLLRQAILAPPPPMLPAQLAEPVPGGPPAPQGPPPPGPGPLPAGPQTAAAPPQAPMRPQFLTPQPIVLITDNHQLHIRHHKAELDSPDARNSPDVVNAVMDHIQEHVMKGNLPPEACAALGIPPQMSPIPPATVPGEPPVPPEARGQPAGPPPEQENPQDRLPSPAKSPISGETPI
jgi:hypothetical protein